MRLSRSGSSFRHGFCNSARARPRPPGTRRPSGLAGPRNAAAWNAWVLGVIVFLVAISAIGRMDFWQEYMNIVLSIWIFIAPWVLGFTLLPRAAGITGSSAC